MIEGFLLGVIVTASLVSGLFFLKFWKHTRDSLFLTFAVAFLVEGANRITYLSLTEPNEGSPWIYVVRLFAFLLILAGILNKNYRETR
jgi:uncharacterized membrane protein HdeD (DUF308 family)